MTAETRYLIETPESYLIGTLVDPDADLDGEFTLRCSESGDLFTVNGWACTITRMPNTK